ncbi:MAG TPA: phytanoyl-CoA dioxygenase family protein [Bdellovibrionota bacterium]|jgi:hypothetical protein|nr:phytanoyl-CoA dioxygenase family protein [Bdellovibrionota bacterium]
MKLLSRPAGFSEEQWQTFMRDGLLVIPNAIAPSELKLADSILLALAKSQSLRLNHVVGLCREMATFIDHPAYAGLVYDVYGEGLRLLSSQGFVRPPEEPGTKRNDWHFDGPRVLPFHLFSEALPMRIKVGIYMSDVTKEKWGNLIYIPGSHRWPHLEQYKTHEKHPEERQLKVEAGTIVLMYSGLWHRVAENTGPHTRRNLYLEYGPSWLQNSEAQGFRADYLESITREQRIILRPYRDPNEFYKPPAEDVPLYAAQPDLNYAAHVTNDLKQYTPQRLRGAQHDRSE